MYYKIGTFAWVFLTCLCLSANASEKDTAAWNRDSVRVSLEQVRSDRSVSVRHFVVPAVLASTSLGIMAVPDLKYRIQDVLNWNASEKVNLYDDEIRYLPLGTVALLSLTGLKGNHKLLEELVVGGISYVLADFIVYRTKQATQVTRPNPDYGTTSFPSQHASMAFVGATLLHREFGHISPWISIGGYGMATWVAYSRIARNRHFLPDVLMGSAVGIASTNATCWLYDALAPSLKSRLHLTPLVSAQGGELLLSCQF
jgi:membrane-associated phospholipid phosphatase